jgi:hypothetical protein
MRQLAESLWVHEKAVRGLGGRMVVIRLADGGLWISTPLALDDELKRAVDALGPVRFLVEGCAFHHVSLPAWIAAYPDAQVIGPPALAKKRADLRFHHLLDDGPAPWGGDPAHVVVGGAPKIAEVDFFHAQSRTLLLSDLCFNVRRGGWLLRTIMKLNGGWDRFGPTRLMRMWTKDRAALKLSVDRIAEWDFDRVIVTHGEVLESGGREAFRAGFDWLQR